MTTDADVDAFNQTTGDASSWWPREPGWIDALATQADAEQAQLQKMLDASAQAGGTAISVAGAEDDIDMFNSGLKRAEHLARAATPPDKEPKDPQH